MNSPSPPAGAGVLFIVPTPLGNLDDMVPRARSVLQSVDLIAAEDTRHSGRLLQHFDIRTPMVAYHDHSQERQTDHLVALLESGKDIALISDAGTPLISDPGFKLVRSVRERQIRVIPIPGACAAIAALSGSGLPSDRFAFEGFPPARDAGRQQFFESLKGDSRTLIFYESPHRVAQTLDAMRSVFGGDRPAVLAREISKVFETFLCGSLQQICDWLAADANQGRGEIVLLVGGAPAETAGEGEITALAERSATTLLEAGLPLKQVAALTARISGERRNRVYSWLLAREKQDRNGDSA